MSALLVLDSALTDDTVVYRTLDFFGASKIFTSSQLMFSRADTFSDRNEGVGRLLAQLEVSRPRGCGRMGWHNDETARGQHELVKRSHFISCWSLIPESVAMWSLYSPDYCSVRISTTIAKLRVVVNNLLEKYSLAHLTESNLGQRIVVSAEGRIAPVTYASLAGISKRVSLRVKAHARLVDRYARHNRKMPDLMDVDPRYYQRENQRRFVELETTFNLKDSSFQHEAEVRLAVRLGEETCSKAVLEKRALLNPSHQYHSIMKEYLRAWGYVTSDALPEREFVSCPADLIESVAVDPRCPPHKAEFIRDWFEKGGMSIVKSDCFGYIPDSFSIYPER